MNADERSKLLGVWINAHNKLIKELKGLPRYDTYCEEHFHDMCFLRVASDKNARHRGQDKWRCVKCGGYVYK